MACTPCRRTSSANRKATSKLVCRGATASSRSLGIVIRVSQYSRSRSMPASAIRARLRPSKEKGRVTMATTIAPCLRAISAATGMAPVPVPPPNPQVRNTMSPGPSTSASSRSLSRAAASPTSAIPPAPRPRVVCGPRATLTGARQVARACRSVLQAMNSTPPNPSSIIRLTAFDPPPPRPTTLSTVAPGAKAFSGRVGLKLKSGEFPKNGFVTEHSSRPPISAARQGIRRSGAAQRGPSAVRRPGP